MRHDIYFNYRAVKVKKKKFRPTTQIGFILSNDCKPAVEITDATWFTIILQHLQ